MTDPNTPGQQGETPNDPTAPPPAPAWGAPPPPPAAPQTPGYGAPTPPSAPTAPGSYDAPPSPPSAYPSPQQGGFPPPPQQPGAFPPPPQQPGGFPTPPAGYAGGGYQSPSSDIGAAFSWGWAKFKANAGALILGLLIWGVGIGIIAVIGFALAGAVAGTATAAQTEAGFNAAASLGVGGTIVVGILVMLAAFVSQIGLTNGYLAIADGRRVSIGDFFKFRNVGQGVLLAVLLGVASGLLSFTGIGSLAVAFFGAFAIYFVVDRGVGAIDAIKASVKLALDNAGVTIVAILVSAAGAIACGLGVFVTVPLAALVLAFVYRRATGGQVAA